MDAKRLEPIPLFADLSRKEREQIARWADEVDVPAGYHLLDQGRFPHEFFVIETGTVAVRRTGSTSRTSAPATSRRDRDHGARAPNRDGRGHHAGHRDRDAGAGLRDDGREMPTSPSGSTKRSGSACSAASRSACRRSRKNARSSSPQSSASTPPVSSTRWFRRSSCSRLPERAREPRLRIRRAEHDAVDPREHDGAGAHRARLQRDVERAAVQPPRARDGARLPQRQDLGVRGGVLQALARVPGGGQHLLVARDHGTDGDVAGSSQSAAASAPPHHPLVEAGSLTRTSTLRSRAAGRR